MRALTLILVMVLILPWVVQGSYGHPRNLWAKTYGGEGYDAALSVDVTEDGGFIIGGDSDFGAGAGDGWIVRLDSAGRVVWERTYGENTTDRIVSVKRTLDGGFVAIGSSSPPLTDPDRASAWVLRLDQSGNVLWQRAYGRSAAGQSIQVTSDGGFVLAGATFAIDGVGHFDFWVVKLDPVGNVVWQRNYGSSLDEVPTSIQQTADGGYVVAGCRMCFDVGGNAWVLRLDTNGNILWQKSYVEGNTAMVIVQTRDGGFFLAGSTYSFGAGNSDVWAIRLDLEGNVVWQKSYGGPHYDQAWSGEQTRDGGFILAGYTWSFGTRGTGSNAWLVKLSSEGEISWERTYGEGGGEGFRSVKQTSDNGYVVVGSTDSFGSGRLDAWVLRLNTRGIIPGCDLSEDSAATSTSTSATAMTTDVESVVSPVTVATTNAVTAVSSAIVQVQCSRGADRPWG